MSYSPASSASINSVGAWACSTPVTSALGHSETFEESARLLRSRHTEPWKDLRR